MAVNLSKNGPALMAAYKEVVDGKSDTNWVLFTYEGNSNDIRLAEKGAGGLEEMVEELSSGKVMYAFCRVPDPNSGLSKFVLINWTGEGVKDSRKGLCANHVSSMANFLKGAHVTINARGDQDVEPDAVLSKVAKTSGANFNFHKQQNEFRDVPRGPVGSVYRKVNAVEEIQQTQKDDFWNQTQRDEEVRRREEQKRAQEERQKVERERKELDETQRREREKRERERGQQIEQERITQKQKEEEEREREQQRRNEMQSDNRKTGINAAASVQKANEARSLISQRSFNPRDVFKQKEQSFDGGDRAPPAAQRPGKLKSPFMSQKSFQTETPAEHHQRPAAPVAVATPAVAPPSPVAVAPLSPVAVAPPSPVAPASPVVSYSPAAALLPPVTTDSPVHHEADEVEDEEGEWSDEFEDDAEEAAPAEYRPHTDLYQAEEPAETDMSLYENIYEEQQQQQQNTEQPAETNGENIRAKALYDYQAADDSEITFDPDDIITEIEMLDEGWWRGYGPDGHYGMFPANYVELL